MVTAKTTALSFGIEPGLKQALRTACRARGLLHMVDVLIWDYCKRNGELQALFGRVDNREREGS